MTSEVTASQTLLLWLNKDPSLLKDAPNLSFIHRSFVFSPRRPWGCIPFFFFFFKVTWFMDCILHILNCGLGSALPQHLLSFFFLLLGTLQSYQSHPGIQHTSWVCSSEHGIAISEGSHPTLLFLFMCWIRVYLASETGFEALYVIFLDSDILRVNFSFCLHSVISLCPEAWSLVFYNSVTSM